MSSSLPLSTVSRAEAASELLQRRRARKGVLDFTCYTKPDYEVNWHHKVICDYLDRFVAGEIPRLMFFMPPRHGKSELVSRRLPAYIFGRNPEVSIISCSYGADLASRMNRDVQRIIDSPNYQRLFPGTQLSSPRSWTTQGKFLRNSDIFEIVGHTGVYRSAGVGGGITGMGCHYGIIDDPIKNREQANSETFREAVWEWYTSTFYTRLEKDAQILLTMTRWHEDDLAGRLLAQSEKEGEEWVVVSFPAISEEERHPDDPRGPNEPLWPGKYSLDRLKNIKTLLGPYQWSALYQQHPTPAEGEILKHYWWRYYYELPEKIPNFHEVLQSWDMAFKDTESSARVCGQVWGRIGANFYLLDEVADQMDFPTTLKAVLRMTKKWPHAVKKLIEDKANGPAIIAMLKNKVPGLIPINPRGSKVARASAVSGLIEAGNVYLPHPSIAPWVEDFVQECSLFPRGKYADRVDTMSQALSQWILVPARQYENEPSVEEAVFGSVRNTFDGDPLPSFDETDLLHELGII